MKSSNIVFDYVNGLFYNCNKISLNKDGSYIDSPEWIKNKKTTESVSLHENNSTKPLKFWKTTRANNKG